MRTIKFRGKRSNDGEWVYGSFIKHRKGESTIFMSDGSGFWVNENTVGQFVGLTDRNGKDVYDGDVVKDGLGRIMKVAYHNYKYCFIAITETNFYTADFYDWSLKAHFPFNNDDDIFSLSVEIIGNIHDNPELLNDNNE